MYEHVEEEAPEFEPAVRTVDEHAVDGHGSVGLDPARLQPVVDETADLQTHTSHVTHFTFSR